MAGTRAKLTGLVVVAGLLGTLPSALARPAQISYRPALERLPGTTLGYSIENVGPSPIGLVALRGVDFTINGATVLSAGGGPAVCNVSGNPPTLTCRNFSLQKGKVLMALIATTRPATQAEQAITDGSEPRSTSFFPQEVTSPQPRGTVQFKANGKNRVQIIGRNNGFVAFSKIHLFVPTRARARVVSLRVVGAPSLRLMRPRGAAGTAGTPCTKRAVKKTYGTPEEEFICKARVEQGAVFYLALRNFGVGVGKHLVWETADGRMYTPNSPPK